MVLARSLIYKHFLKRSYQKLTEKLSFGFDPELELKKRSQQLETPQLETNFNRIREETKT